MANPVEVLVVGGGVIGLSVAYYLAREGVRVQVIDQGDLGQESSWAGAGILTPASMERARTPKEKLRAWSFKEYRRLCQELHERTSIDSGLVSCGGLEAPEDASATMTEEWRGTVSTPVQKVSGSALRQLAPELAEDIEWAWYLPELAQLRNPRHLKALIAACSSLGVDLLSRQAARRFIRRGSKIDGVETDRGTLPAGHFVVATGAWTGGLLAPLGFQLDIKPIRGQIVLLHAPDLTLRPAILQDSRYMVPRGDGNVLVGSTEEDVGFDKQTTASAVLDLLRLAVQLVPRLSTAAVERTWAGLRPGSPDGLPYIDRLPHLDNIYIAAGHYRSGIQLAPGTAMLINEMILAQPLTMDLDSFRLGERRSVSPS